MAFPQQSVQEVDEATMEAIRRLVFEKSGISLRGDKRSLVSARLIKRMRVLGVDSYPQYMRRLRNDPTGEELMHLLDVISTNVTSFFREDSHFAELAAFVGRAMAAGQQRFRMWSAACSSGEEPYSMVMTLLDSAPAGMDLKILGTDISRTILECAMAGEYSKERGNQIPPLLRQKYMTTSREGYRVLPHVMDKVVYRHANLSLLPMVIPGPMDVIFCRNVMIYFEDDLRGRLVKEFYRILRPGGLLMVGHSESLAGLQGDFARVRPSVYLKPEGAT